MIARRSTAQHGFSLVEVLIALIIMTIGMLGIAGLYVQSLQAGRTSLFRHHAVNLAGDVADRIRANPRAGAEYEGEGENKSCVGAGIDCDEAERAANDVFLWLAQADDTLPDGLVDVDFDADATPPEYTIRVEWNEPEGEQAYEIVIPVRAL